MDDVKKKLRYDNLYAKSVSLSTDMKIVVGTIPTMLGAQSRFKLRTLFKDRELISTSRN